ncbi:MAG: T9SS type A sorting domain-containing protein [Flavobacteriales bacterium]|nr:T9SS type A sorting domain-containing protein [Flavobacteriales bacterium]
MVSVSPDSAYQNQTLNVVITGSSTNFGQGTSTTQIWLSQGATIIPSNSVFAANNSQLIVNFTIGGNVPTGLYDVNAYNTIDGYFSLIEGFEVLPIITEINENIEPIAVSKVYPNPFKNTLKLEYTLEYSSKVQIIMFDTYGRIISNSITENKQPGNYLHEFKDDIINLPAGNYFVRLRTDKKDYNYKLLKN